MANGQLAQERNREHAKRSRIRKKFMLECLQEQLLAMRKQNLALRQVGYCLKRVYHPWVKGLCLLHGLRAVASSAFLFGVSCAMHQVLEFIQQTQLSKWRAPRWCVDFALVHTSTKLHSDHDSMAAKVGTSQINQGRILFLAYIVQSEATPNQVCTTLVHVECCF